MPENQLRLMRPEEFFTSPEEFRAISDVKQELREGHESVLDEAQLREQEDWTFLANRVVGAEER